MNVTAEKEEFTLEVVSEMEAYDALISAQNREIMGRVLESSGNDSIDFLLYEALVRKHDLAAFGAAHYSISSKAYLLWVDLTPDVTTRLDVVVDEDKVLSITPHCYYDGSRVLDYDEAVKRAERWADTLARLYRRGC